METPATKNIAVPIATHESAKKAAVDAKETLSEFTDMALRMRLAKLLWRKQPATKHPKKG